MSARAMRAAGRVLAACLATVFAACGGSPPPAPAPPPKTPVATVPKPPAPGAPATTTAAKPPVAMAAPEIAGPEIPKYEPHGRRDPFEALDRVVGSGGPGLVATARLTGIVRSTNSTLALLETPDGIGYILRPGDTLGDGRLLEIGSDSVVFLVASKPGAPTNRVVLKLATN